MMTAPWLLDDGTVAIRPPRPGEASVLVAGRDEEWEKWLGPGDSEPKPIACIVVGGAVVGWVDYDTDREWLGPGEVNIGYNVFAPHRRRGFASRGVLLLLQRLATEGQYRTATLTIRASNEASLGVAARTGFVFVGRDAENLRFARPIGPGHDWR